MTFYRDTIRIGEELEEMGHKVLYPESALMMQKRNDFDPKRFKDTISAKERGKFIKLHFNKELKSDAILVVNKTKNNIKGYIGANVLMEMGIAFSSGVRIYILHPISKKQPFQEEIFAMSPIIFRGKLDILNK